jgi:hypothetical protein
MVPYPWKVPGIKANVREAGVKEWKTIRLILSNKN